LLPQTRRHSYLASLLGIPNLLVAINKMDLVDYGQEVFSRLQNDFLSLAERLRIRAVECVPVSALEGDNIVDRSRNMEWYSGPTLLEHLETVQIEPASSVNSIRFPVQYVIRPDAGFRGFAGQIAGGTVRPGDAVMALPSRQTTQIESIVAFDGELDAAVLSQSVTLKLADEIDLSRGDMLVSPHAPPSVSAHLSAAVVWLNETPLQLNRSYIAKHTTRQVKAKVKRIQYRVDVNTLAQEPAQELGMNGIAVLEIETSSPLFFDSYESSRTTGSFILVDPLSNATVGAGMIREDLSKPRHGGVGYEEPALGIGTNTINSQERFQRHGHRPAIFVFGKDDSLAKAAERILFDKGFETILLHERSISSGSLTTTLNILGSAGLIVLLVSDGASSETQRAVESLAGGSFLDLSSEQVIRSRQELLGTVVLAAESLRLQPGLEDRGKAS
jgi:sulfate adenylyltransferase large subunit